MILGIDAHNLREGGGITHLINLLAERKFRQEFEKIYVFGNQRLRKELKKLQDDKISFVHHPFLEKTIFYRVYWQQFLLFKYLKELKVNMLFSPGGILPLIWPRNVKTVTMCRSMLTLDVKKVLNLGFDFRYFKFWLLKKIQLNSFRRANGVIFVSNYARKIVEEIYPDLLSRDILIYHGINQQLFQKVIKRNLKKEEVRILYVSSVDVYKNQWEVVKAIDILVKRGYKNIKLKLVGGGYPRAVQYMKNIISDLNLQNLVDYAGKVPYQSIYEEYAKASIFVFASSCENCPNILLESMACGLPIACSNNPPMPEFALDAVRYFDPENPESIAGAISYFIDNPEKAEKMGICAREITKKYRWDDCAKKTSSFLKCQK